MLSKNIPGSMDLVPLSGYEKTLYPFLLRPRAGAVSTQGEEVGPHCDRFPGHSQLMQTRSRSVHRRPPPILRARPQVLFLLRAQYHNGQANGKHHQHHRNHRPEMPLFIAATSLPRHDTPCRFLSG